jgi:hypothetical protein
VPFAPTEGAWRCMTVAVRQIEHAVAYTKFAG